MNIQTEFFSSRNVTVLRKDMGEARQLMKGIKEDETSISTASSLSEAAKYLGLKWNIQDANYTRTQKEENERERKESTNDEDRDENKKQIVPKEKKKKKKSLIEKEQKKKVSKELEDIKIVEISNEIAHNSSEAANATDIDQPNKDVKRKTPIRKSKTLSVFEPFSMDKEITEIKEKIVELDNKERERIETENLKRIEEEEQEENDKKTIEIKQEEAKAAAEAAVEAVNEVMAAKDLEQKKKEEAEAEEALKKQMEIEAANKAADEDLEKLNQILKKPRGRLARKYLAEQEKAEAESAKLVSETKVTQKSLSASSVTPKKDEAKVDENIEKTNGGPENTNKDESDNESEEAGAEGSDIDPYAGELSSEDKEKKAETDAQDPSRIFDFMKEPLFTVCVEGAEGRLALLQWEPMGLHVYCHQYQQLNYDIAIKVGCYCRLFR